MSTQEKEGSTQEINPNEAEEFLHSLVPRAGYQLKKYFTTGKIERQQKDITDITTSADSEVEEILVEGIREKYPTSVFLAEETAPENYAKFESMENLWVIDPLDGIGNFSRGKDEFAISVALLDRGRVKLGFVHLPIFNQTIKAMEDKEGATINGVEISVSNVDQLRESVIASEWSYNPPSNALLLNWMESLYPSVNNIPIGGSAVYTLMELAQGKIDGYLFPGSKPWDVAASALIIQKAGGKVTTEDGSSWTPFSPNTVASNGHLHDRLLSAISSGK